MYIRMTLQEYFRKRKLSDSSYRAYMQRLRALNGGTEPKTADFLEDVERVLKYINTLSNNTQRSYLITVTQALKSTNQYEDEKEVYELKLEELENKRTEMQQAYQKTDKEKERMCSMEELNAVADYWLEMIDESVYNAYSPTKIYNIYKSALVALLYTEQAPIRLEYGGMELIKRKSDIKSGRNYLLTSGDTYQFILQEFKTKKSQGEKIWTVKSTRLKNILDEWFKINTSKYLFPNKSYDAPMGMNAFGKLIPKVFESIGKKITLNILRHVWISHHVDYKVLESHKDLAAAMCHNVDTQKTYIKI